MRDKDLFVIVDETFADALYHLLVKRGIPVLTALRDDFSKLKPQDIKNALHAFYTAEVHCYRKKRKELHGRIAKACFNPFALSEAHLQIKREAANYAAFVLEDAVKCFTRCYETASK